MKLFGISRSSAPLRLRGYPRSQSSQNFFPPYPPCRLHVLVPLRWYVPFTLPLRSFLFRTQCGNSFRRTSDGADPRILYEIGLSRDENPCCPTLSYPIKFLVLPCGCLPFHTPLDQATFRFLSSRFDFSFARVAALSHTDESSVPFRTGKAFHFPCS